MTLRRGYNAWQEADALPVIVLDEGTSGVSVFRFGVFELDLRTGELRKAGVLLNLPPQPFKILALLASHAGQLVTREEIQKQIWGSETFVDFEQGLNFAIKKIRTALGDDAETPRYIETLPRRGYRFIAPVSAESRDQALAARAASEAGRGTLGTPAEAPSAPAPLPGSRVSSGPAWQGAASGLPGELRESGLAGGRDAPRKSVPALPPADASPRTASGGMTRRAVSALVDAVLEVHRSRTRWRRWTAALFGAALLALLFALNVGGLRDRLLRRAGSGHIQSLAVIPLENLSSDREQDYFADGMTDELIASLARVSALRVISRTSVMHYKGTRKTLPEIARELKVDAVVEGTVLRSGDRVRITAQLIEAATDKNLWVGTYDRDVRDILDLQSAVARDIANEIRIKLTPQEHVQLAKTRLVNPEAYEAYLRGRYYWNQRTEAGIQKSIEYFQQAIQKEPGYALAYSGLADGYMNLSDNLLPPKEAVPEARVAAKKALQIDPTLAEAHTLLGDADFYYDWSWPAAENEYKQALQLDPNYAPAHQRYGRYLSAMGRFDEAQAEMTRALQLDPLSLVTSAQAGLPLYFARHYVPAVEQFRKTIQLDPNFYLGHWYLGMAYTRERRFPEATVELERARLLNDDSDIVAALGYAYAVSGKSNRALQLLADLKKRSTRRFVSPFEVATIYIGLGMKDAAFAWLEKAYAERSDSLVFLKVDPSLDSVRPDPRFLDLVRRIGLQSNQK